MFLLSLVASLFLFCFACQNYSLCELYFPVGLFISWFLKEWHKLEFKQQVLFSNIFTVVEMLKTNVNCKHDGENVLKHMFFFQEPNYLLFLLRNSLFKSKHVIQWDLIKTPEPLSAHFMAFRQLKVPLKPPFIPSKHILHREFNFQLFFLQSTAVNMFFTEKDPSLFIPFFTSQRYV